MWDKENPAWSVILQKEPRSKRNEEDVDERVFGATGYSDPLPSAGHIHGSTDSKIGHEHAEGEHVPLQEVAMVDALMEDVREVNGYDDMDLVDDNDDDHLEEPGFDELNSPFMI